MRAYGDDLFNQKRASTRPIKALLHTLLVSVAILSSACAGQELSVARVTTVTREDAQESGRLVDLQVDSGKRVTSLVSSGLGLVYETGFIGGEVDLQRRLVGIASSASAELVSQSPYAGFRPLVWVGPSWGEHLATLTNGSQSNTRTISLPTWVERTYSPTMLSGETPQVAFFAQGGTQLAICKIDIVGGDDPTPTCEPTAAAGGIHRGDWTADIDRDQFVLRRGTGPAWYATVADLVFVEAGGDLATTFEAERRPPSDDAAESEPSYQITFAQEVDSTLLVVIRSGRTDQLVQISAVDGAPPVAYLLFSGEARHDLHMITTLWEPPEESATPDESSEQQRAIGLAGITGDSLATVEVFVPDDDGMLAHKERRTFRTSCTPIRHMVDVSYVGDAVIRCGYGVGTVGDEALPTGSLLSDDLFVRPQRAWPEERALAWLTPGYQGHRRQRDLDLGTSLDAPLEQSMSGRSQGSRRVSLDDVLDNGVQVVMSTVRDDFQLNVSRPGSDVTKTFAGLRFAAEALTVDDWVVGVADLGPITWVLETSGPAVVLPLVDEGPVGSALTTCASATDLAVVLTPSTPSGPSTVRRFSRAAGSIIEKEPLEADVDPDDLVGCALLGSKVWLLTLDRTGTLAARPLNGPLLWERELGICFEGASVDQDQRLLAIVPTAACHGAPGLAFVSTVSAKGPAAPTRVEIEPAAVDREVQVDGDRCSVAFSDELYLSLIELTSDRCG